MRLVSVFLLTIFLTPGVANAQGPTDEPIGNLAQLMRGIMFPNSNKLFDLQSTEPGAELEPLSATTAEILYLSPAAAKNAPAPGTALSPR